MPKTIFYLLKGDYIYIYIYIYIWPGPQLNMAPYLFEVPHDVDNPHLVKCIVHGSADKIPSRLLA